jgi:hypothetical protein
MADISDKEKLERMKKALEDIFQTADDAMDDPAMGGRALLSFRWLKKLALRGLGDIDD